MAIGLDAVAGRLDPDQGDVFVTDEGDDDPEVPSGDALAIEFQRFLKNRDSD